MRVENGEDASTNEEVITLYQGQKKSHMTKVSCDHAQKYQKS